MLHPPEVAAMSEFHDEYSESLDAEFRKLEDALLSDEVGLLAPSEPIRLPPDASVAEAVTRMVDSQDRKSTRLNSSHSSPSRMPSSA